MRRNARVAAEVARVKIASAKKTDAIAFPAELVPALQCVAQAAATPNASHFRENGGTAQVMDLGGAFLRVGSKASWSRVVVSEAS